MQFRFRFPDKKADGWIYLLRSLIQELNIFITNSNSNATKVCQLLRGWKTFRSELTASQETSYPARLFGLNGIPTIQTFRARLDIVSAEDCQEWIKQRWNEG